MRKRDLFSLRNLYGVGEIDRLSSAIRKTNPRDTASSQPALSGAVQCRLSRIFSVVIARRQGTVNPTDPSL